MYVTIATETSMEEASVESTDDGAVAGEALASFAATVENDPTRGIHASERCFGTHEGAHLCDEESTGACGREQYAFTRQTECFKKEAASVCADPGSYDCYQVCARALLEATVNNNFAKCVCSGVSCSECIDECSDFDQQLEALPVGCKASLSRPENKSKLEPVVSDMCGKRDEPGRSHSCDYFRPEVQSGAPQQDETVSDEVISGPPQEDPVASDEVISGPPESDPVSSDEVFSGAPEADSIAAHEVFSGSPAGDSSAYDSGGSGSPMEYSQY